MAYLDLDGFKLYYEVHEGLCDQDSLFIHGNLACHLWWHPTREAFKDSVKKSGLKKNGRMVIADWRGCGLSKGLNSKEDIDFTEFAKDYLKLIEHLNLQSVNVVGHSTGGLIAMLAILEEPQAFRSLTLLDSIGPRGIELELPEEQVMGHFQMISENRALCDQVIAATIENVDIQSDLFKKIADATFNVDSPIFTGVPEVLIHKIDIVERMKDINLPTLILHGEKDLVLPVEGSERLSKWIPYSQFKILKGHGHSYNMEDPKAFSEDLQSFWVNSHQ
ncbi:alpha/beta hydrolase [bacterium]|nr:alpha/beta hydrolase [bacterium]